MAVRRSATEKENMQNDSVWLVTGDEAPDVAPCLRPGEPCVPSAARRAELMRELEEREKASPLDKIQFGADVGDAQFVATWNDIVLPEASLLLELAGLPSDIDDLVFTRPPRVDPAGRARRRNWKKQPLLRKRLQRIGESKLYAILLQRYRACIRRANEISAAFSEAFGDLQERRARAVKMLSALEEQIIRNHELLAEFVFDSEQMTQDERDEMARQRDISFAWQQSDFFEEEFRLRAEDYDELSEEQRKLLVDTELGLKELLADCADLFLEAFDYIGRMDRSEERIYGLLRRYHDMFDDFRRKMHAQVAALAPFVRRANRFPDELLRERRPAPPDATDDNDAV